MTKIVGSGSSSQRHGSRIRISGSGSGSTPKCHGSATLVINQLVCCWRQWLGILPRCCWFCNDVIKLFEYHNKCVTNNKCSCSIFFFFEVRSFFCHILNTMGFPNDGKAHKIHIRFVTWAFQDTMCSSTTTEPSSMLPQWYSSGRAAWEAILWQTGG